MKLKLNKYVSMTRIIFAFIIIMLIVFPLHLININFPKYLINNKIIVDLKYILAGSMFVLYILLNLLYDVLSVKLNLVTNINRFINYITNNILINSIIILLSCYGFINPFISILLVSREMLISYLKLLSSSDIKPIENRLIEKVKTVLILISISLIMFYNLPFELINLMISNYLILVSLIVSYIGAFQYYKDIQNSILNKNLNKTLNNN